jgi:predicted peptidase
MTLPIRAPKSGGEDPSAYLARLVGPTPVWNFHGSDDPLIPVSEGRRMAEAMRAQGGEVRYSELAGVGHNAWDPAYYNPDLPAWLLAQHRPIQ